ncbi:hypothetical protein [Cronobacter dublinensis]|uniref:hypothetical protein n=1 Tax=Cronobacter dublinensis TaxID=413497 RepID=UPI00131A13D7|nr:hypothetical protein [Cronobacter dublinensis]
MTRTLRLENGVTLTLIHQPQATQAAALWRVNAGSLHEPDAGRGSRTCWSICCFAAATVTRMTSA